MDVTDRDIFNFFAEARRRGIIIAEREPSHTLWFQWLNPIVTQAAWDLFTADCFARQWVPGVEQASCFIHGAKQDLLAARPKTGQVASGSEGGSANAVPVDSGVPAGLRGGEAQLPEESDADFWEAL